MDKIIDAIVSNAAMVHVSAVAGSVKAIYPMLTKSPEMVNFLSKTFVANSEPLITLCEKIMECKSMQHFESDMHRDVYFSLLFGEAAIAELQAVQAALRSHPLAPKQGGLSEEEIERMIKEENAR